MLIILLHFKRKLQSVVPAVPFIPHQQCIRVLIFLHPGQSVLFSLYLFLFNSSNHNGYEVVSHCNFDQHFPKDQWTSQAASGKEPAYQYCWRCERHGFDPQVRKILVCGHSSPLPVFSPGESLDRGTWWAAESISSQ